MSSPGQDDAAFQAGLDHLRGGDRPAAIAAFERLLRTRPSHLGARVSLGSALMGLGRPAEAEPHYRRALALHPHHPIALRNLGVLLDGAERHAEALALAEAALAAQATHGEALFVRGNALTGLGRFEAAVAAYHEAAAHQDDPYDALTRLGLALAALGRHGEALEVLDRAVALKPDAPIAIFRRAIVRLQTRDFAGGWPGYEARWRMETHLAQSAGVVPRDLIPRLDACASPDALAGKRVLLLGEQGIGDQLMFASMIPDLQALAASVACVCEPRLVRLFQASLPGVSFAGPRDAAIRMGDIDAVVAMGSLGRLFRTTAADFPGTPFLRPRPEVTARWAERLGPRPARLRIGLSWRGGTNATRKDTRSLSLEQLAPILDLPGCEVISLQYGDPREELAAFNAGRAQPIRVFAPQDIDDFEDLAGLVANLDGVVTVQTALAHLAGALGAPALTMVPHNAEWRYTASGPDMPWYRSLRLFRQPAPGDWTPVLHDVALALDQRLAQRGRGD